MNTDVKFIEGLIVKPPHRNAPSYVKAKLSIKREEMIEFLQQQEGEWINADIKESQGGKWYAAIDNWKPDGQRNSRPAAQQQQPAPADDFQDDIPF